VYHCSSYNCIGQPLNNIHGEIRINTGQGITDPKQRYTNVIVHSIYPVQLEDGGRLYEDLMRVQTDAP
jgi:hypothetical protein